jgi:natural product biosynthesis luciferase-like monooxygenase protein
MAFVGDVSLLTLCADAALGHGNEIVAIVTCNSLIEAWARQRGVPVIREVDVQEEQVEVQAAVRLAGLDFDYLFSVGYLDVIPTDMLRLARKLAINFHDGPLPQYAGLNATSWALINRETRHGVTWHEMVDKPDAGRIVAAAEVAIDPGDTALSLNAKCYEAGLGCFEQLLERIADNTVELVPQVGKRRYYGRSKRPPAAGTLNLAQPAEVIVDMVRALNVGPYGSPLGFAKLYVDDRILLIGEASVVADFVSSAIPGTLIAVDTESVTLTTSSAPVRLAGIRFLDGSPVVPSEVACLAEGHYIAPIEAELSAQIDALNEQAAAAETYWDKIYTRTPTVVLPFPRVRAGSTNQEKLHFRLRSRARPEDKIAAVLAWVARVSGSQRIAVPCRSSVHDRTLGRAKPWFARWRPLVVDLAPSMTAEDAVGMVAHAIRELEAAPPLACDLRISKVPSGSGTIGAESPSFAISIGGGEEVESDPPAALHVVFDPATDEVSLWIRCTDFDDTVAGVIAAQVQTALSAFVDARGQKVGELSYSHDAEAALFDSLSAGSQQQIQGVTIPELVAAQAQRTPDALAIKTRWEALTYAELQRRVDLVACRLMTFGVGARQIVGVCLERTSDLVVALLAVMRTGAAYLPLDPKYPPDRIDFMLNDARASLVVASMASATRHKFGRARIQLFNTLLVPEKLDERWTPPHINGEDLAYLIYTSGSTGHPKGVMVRHCSVANFFQGMDARIAQESPGTWLGVASPNFDISVLELFWTLARGFTVALHGAVPPKTKASTPSFSLFYFAADCDGEEEPYRLLLEGAKFADANEFEAVWLPERHFHEFGGAYPNPAVAAAAIAAVTTHVHIRAGSCVLPLHNPIRVAEDWAVVDVLSRGRSGVAIASGWQPADFVLMPDAFKERKQLMLSRLEEVRRLWRGEAVSYPDANGATTGVRTLPRPVQKDLPVWLTAARNLETFEIAAQRGCGVLTHLLGMSLKEVGDNIRSYRAAWRSAGHKGRGHVTLMLHTFVGESDTVAHAAAREPMLRYLSSAMDLVRSASWNFPTFAAESADSQESRFAMLDAEPISIEEADVVLDSAFERYFESSGLIGSPDKCLKMVKQVSALDVDEIACLIDFGIPFDDVLAQLPRLKCVKDLARYEVSSDVHFSLAQDILYFNATHVQCTPSHATLILADDAAALAMAKLKCLLVGGEELTQPVAKDLRSLLAPEAKLLNMYGPTETTIWSTVCSLDRVDDFVPLGEPIANTTLRVADSAGQLQPALVPGELWIGGAGIAKGYWGRPDLTAERFAFPIGSDELMYRTGDLVRRHPDGRLEFLGRLDNQVKIRGHRIELGEIEAAMERMPGVAQAVVVAGEGIKDDGRLTAFYVEKPNARCDEVGLRAALRDSLPEIMVPVAYVRLAAFPLTPNGKVDRKALFAPKTEPDTADFGPSEGTEALVAKVWRQCLGLDRVGLTKNFFDLGGHSLTAIQVTRRLRAELGCQVSLTDVFRYPTVRSLACHLDGEHRENDAVDAAAARAKARLAARRRGSVWGVQEHLR